MTDTQSPHTGEQVTEADERAAAAYLDDIERRQGTGVRVTGVLPCSDGSPHPLALAFARHRLTTAARQPKAMADQSAEARLRETDLLYVPGVWRCAKCQFTLIQSNLNAADGTVTARDDPGDKCPNDASPLWRVSWRSWATENEKLWEEHLQRKDDEITRLRAEVEAKDEDAETVVERVALAIMNERRKIMRMDPLEALPDEDHRKRDEIRFARAALAALHQGAAKLPPSEGAAEAENEI